MPSSTSTARLPVSQTILYAWFVLLLAASLCFSSTVVTGDTLPATAEDIQPLKTGNQAPSFTVKTVDGEDYRFDASSLDAPTILISFRGGWCPYCNMHLSELRHVIPQINAMGVDVLFISNDRPEILYSSLAGETREDIEGLDYTILSDADLNAALAFGTAFRTPDDMIERLKKRRPDRDLQESSIERFSALAVPAVYAVDAEGRIVFDYVNADYKVRLPADELLAVATDIAAD